MQKGNMAHMARDMAETSENVDTATAPELANDEGGYPYGLCLRLEEDELQKLGVKTLPPVGKELKISAIGKVESVSESNSPHNFGDRALTIQITHLAPFASTKGSTAGPTGSATP